MGVPRWIWDARRAEKHLNFPTPSFRVAGPPRPLSIVIRTALKDGLACATCPAAEKIGVGSGEENTILPPRSLGGRSVPLSEERDGSLRACPPRAGVHWCERHREMRRGPYPAAPRRAPLRGERRGEFADGMGFRGCCTSTHEEEHTSTTIRLTPMGSGTTAEA